MNKLLIVDRHTLNAGATLSKMYVAFCAGLEDQKRAGDKVKGKTCIPDGTYPLALRYSPKFSTNYYTRDNENLISKKEYLNLPSAIKPQYKPHDLMWIKDVPGFEYILIHWGNTAKDTDGCYLVGAELGKLGGEDAVLTSRVTYVKLYKAIAAQIRKGGQSIEYKSI